MNIIRDHNSTQAQFTDGRWLDISNEKLLVRWHGLDLSVERPYIVVKTENIEDGTGSLHVLSSNDGVLQGSLKFSAGEELEKAYRLLQEYAA